MSNYCHFIIVAEDDTPIYEVELNRKSAGESRRSSTQFILHAALDVVDEHAWTNTNMYFKCLDKFTEDYFVSYFVTAGHVRFMLLHTQKQEDLIKNFFTEVHELYLKILLNPFYAINSPITSPTFDKRVKHLGTRFR